MNSSSYILCLGSNAIDGDIIISDAISLLSQKYTVSAQSQVISSEDVKMSGRLYLNTAIKLICNKEVECLKDELKGIERMAGRVSGSDVVTLDIDIIGLNGKIIHHDYYDYVYVRRLTNEIILKCGVW